MELSKYIWKLKDEGETPSITWNIMSVVNCRPRGGVCRLCLTEKLWLLKHFNHVNLLNKKSEFISKCRHKKQTANKIDRVRVVCFCFVCFVSFVSKLIYLFILGI